MRPVLCAVVSLLPLVASAEPQLSVDGERALQTLLRARVFAAAKQREADETSDSVKAIRVLFREVDADSAFKKLLREGTLEGQLYALCGLFYTDHAYFLKAVERYRHRADTVMLLHGHVSTRVTASTVVESQSSTVVRLSDPSQSIVQWLKSEGKGVWWPDIIGGGFPSSFKDPQQWQRQ